jgi:hypothetical protein
MLAFATFFLTALLNTVAQQPPPGGPPPQGPPPQYPPPAASMQQPLEDGPCLDSSRAVPKVIAPPVLRATQVVRIDEVVSTATMTPTEIIGFLYTTQDGSTWLGERSAHYMSPADATAINLLLGSTHLPGENVTQFPPQSRYGVPTNLPQLFKVAVPPDAMVALHITLAPCVAWPPGRPLPDPSM